MTDAPERIWIDACGGKWSPVSGGTQREEYIRADLCRPEPQGWQPIGTAPKDGTIVILLPWGEVEDLFVSYWMQSENRWANNEWSKITHWMPLPEPPKP